MKKMKARPGRPGLLLRLLTFLVTAALVLGAVFLVVNYEKLNFDALRRWFTYRSLGRSDSGQAESFPCAGGSANRLAPVNSDLLACSANTIRLYSGSGAVYVDEGVSLEHPAVDSAGSRAIAYDAGGQRLYAYGDRAPAFDLELEGAILSATVNESGWVAVTAQETRHKGAVIVYSPAGQAVMQADFTSSFVMDAAVSPDSRSVAVLTVGLSGGGFESTVSVYPLEGGRTDGVPAASCPVGNNVILDLRWTDGGIWCLGDSGAALVTPEGALAAACGFDGRYLKAFSLEGDGFAVMLLGKYRSGTAAELSVLDSKGNTTSLPVGEQVLSLSAAGRYIAVLTAGRLDIYTHDLTLYDSLDLEDAQSARTVILRPDGTAVLISSESARLYVPN